MSYKSTPNNNKQNIVHIIIDNPGIYCAKISRYTGLSITAVMKITDYLVKSGIITKSGKCELKKGKRPETFKLNSKAFYLIGVDVGTTMITSVLMDLSAKIHYKYQVKTSKDHTPNVIFEQINAVIENIFSNNKAFIPKILGVGIGFAGIISPKTKCIELSPAFGWKDINVSDFLKIPYSRPFIIENVTKAMALGEKWFGIAKNNENMLCVNLGYGIGSAMILDNEVYNGDFYAAGELGHMVLEKDGPVCDCGNRGCLQALASAKSIASKAVSGLAKHPKSLLNQFSNNSIECKDVFDCALKGDSFALELVKTATNYIGIALANVVNLLDINLIVLEGGMTKSSDFLLENIKKSLQNHIIHFTDGKVRLKISNFGDTAVSIGTATLVFKNFIENGM